MFTYIDVIILFISVLTIVLTILLTGQPRPPIFNVYQRPTRTYWFKVAFLYVVLKLRQVRSRIEDDTLKYSKKIDKYALLDRPQTLSDHNQAVDAVYFNGANSSGDHLVVGTARRKNKLVDAFLYVKVKDSQLGVLETPKLPSTELYQTEEVEEYAVEGINIASVETMKRWKISYAGKMKCSADRSRFLDVVIDAEWTSNLPCFNADTDMDPLSMAKSVALEPWSKNYFNTVKEIHQTHYEQYGIINGTVIIDGKTYNLNMDTLRDHSVAYKRDWKNLHRYGLHFINVENGDRITAGIISTPITFSCLTLGFVYSAKAKEIFPITQCDLMLHQHGEGGDPPLDYGFSLKAGNRTYVIKVHVTDSPYFYISKDWEAKIFERLCTFKVNNLKGWGAAEWLYRNTKGKDVEDYVKV